MRSPGRAPARRTARPVRTSPKTVTLIRISLRRVVSPPASAQSKRRDARRRPARNSSSQRPVCRGGRAMLSRKHRGVPPIAATSLTARARHFHPTASAGCLFRRKCVPSRNQSQVRIVSYSLLAIKRAASSPGPRRTPWSDPWRRRPAICRIRRSKADSPRPVRSAEARVMALIFRGEYSSRLALPEPQVAYGGTAARCSLASILENLSFRTGIRVLLPCSSGHKIQG